jgi:hypothetical protein
MLYATHNTIDININGTHLQGYLDCDFQTLTEVFGQPLRRGYDDYKVDAQWDIKFADNSVASIYNWKNGYNYLGTAGKHVTQITQWNIGGFDKHAVDRINAAIKEFKNAKSLAKAG